MLKKFAQWVHSKLDQYRIWPWLCLGSYILGLLGPASIIIAVISVYVLWIITPYVFNSASAKGITKK